MIRKQPKVDGRVKMVQEIILSNILNSSTKKKKVIHQGIKRICDVTEISADTILSCLLLS